MSIPFYNSLVCSWHVFVMEASRVQKRPIYVFCLPRHSRDVSNEYTRLLNPSISLKFIKLSPELMFENLAQPFFMWLIFCSFTITVGVFIHSLVMLLYLLRQQLCLEKGFEISI